MSVYTKDRDQASRLYAIDWRRQCTLLGSQKSRWAVPLVDVMLSALVLIIAVIDAEFLVKFGPLPTYVASFILTLIIAVAQFIRRTAVRTSFVITALALIALGILLAVSPVPLGLSPVYLTALTTLHAVIRWDGAKQWCRTAVALAILGSLANPLLLLRVSPAYSALTGQMAVDGSGGWLITVLLAAAVCLLSVALTAMDASVRRRRVQDWHRELELTKEAARQATAAEERLRLARELHDLVGHSLTAIKVQAASALVVSSEEDASPALKLIEETAASSLQEVRELVRLLRGVGDIEPSASLSALRTEVDRFQSVGLALTAHILDSNEITMADTQWTRMQRLAVLRATQEGLTNALKHGDGTATVHVSIDTGWCVICVTNPLRSAALTTAAQAGTGLDGLRERMRLVGGAMTTELRQNSTIPVFILKVRVPVSTQPLDSISANSSQTEHQNNDGIN
ncbi:sensor histidine kinase [Schaalia vaccimaxillae]|uniref:sensor histidine kinase n=1 Tax=Schaalia vaccimaxillae TaxID=183916 RepID=UPI0003B5BBF8|nr:histidine kinase [Schaalia vaccimaxillae]